jgi:sigma-E factor negative regulatory protein RseB
MGVNEWLQRMHAGARQRNYVGTFVVSAPGGDLSSARIWHVRDGEHQIERIEALSGPPRSTFRRNRNVMTFLPEAKVVKVEKRENLDLFPNLPDKPDSSIADFYDVRAIGKDRVAGFDADVVQLVPHDGLRFGYRIWSERRSGLVVKLQTIDSDSRVVEQSAFSELQLDAPVKAQALSQMMANTTGYRIEKLGAGAQQCAGRGLDFECTRAGFQAAQFLPPRPRWTPAASPSRTPAPCSGPSPTAWPRCRSSSSATTRARAARRRDDHRRDQRHSPPPARTGQRLVADGVGEVPPQTLNAFAQSLARTR